MLFFFKEKPIEIIAYVNPTYNFVREFNPIVPARDYIPTWWKNTPSSKLDWKKLDIFKTVKSCPGIISILSTGFILPNWSDLAIKYSKESFQYKFADKLSQLDYHPDFQSPNFYTEHHHFKIPSPWIIKSPTKLLIQYPFYQNTENYPLVSPPGILSPVKNLCALNIFLFLEKFQEEKRQEIKKGAPLLQIIPLTERKVTIRCETVDNYEFDKMKSTIGTDNSFGGRGLKNLRADSKS